MTAINYQDRAIDVACSFRAKKDRSFFDVCNQPKAPERYSLAKFLFDWFGDQPLHPFCILDWARSYRVDANTMAPPLNCQITGKRIDPGLGGRNMKLHRCSEVMKGGADVENLTLVLLEFGKSRPANIKSALEINIHDGPESVWRKLLWRAKKVAGSPVDNYVDLAELRYRRRNGALDFFRAAHVCGYRKSFSAIAIDCIRRRFQMFHLAANQRNGRSRFGQGSRYAAGNACTAAGDEGHTITQDSFSKDVVGHTL